MLDRLSLYLCSPEVQELFGTSSAQDKVTAPLIFCYFPGVHWATGSGGTEVDFIPHKLKYI